MATDHAEILSRQIPIDPVKRGKSVGFEKRRIRSARVGWHRECSLVSLKGILVFFYSLLLWKEVAA